MYFLGSDRGGESSLAFAALVPKMWPLMLSLMLLTRTNS